MKIISKIVITGMLTGLLFQSCTKLEEPFYTVKSVYADTNMRAMILEDYTGHKCTNCAPASRTAENLQSLYKGQVFVIAVHAGDFAEPDSVKYGGILKNNFICQAGTDWFNYQSFKIDQNPKGMVNRISYEGKISFGKDDWAGAVANSASMTKLAVISMNNVYNPATKILTSNIGGKFLSDISGKVNLCVCILEDSIYGGQLNSVPGDSIPYYKHFRFMDVLRGTLSGSWGEQVSENPLRNSVISRTYTFDFSTQPTWVVSHCSLVAFIMNGETKEIYHAAKKPVIKTQ
ncbi:MAG: Omp28-related outer membrane protein [Bacteroidales bacterium]|nr:Omp28-related outer membrane protein [Bacteroidales bacterium]